MRSHNALADVPPQPGPFELPDSGGTIETLKDVKYLFRAEPDPIVAQTDRDAALASQRAIGEA
jgi:hypothetical protein